MACNKCNSEYNPCDCEKYDNCGCLNPTTFGCTTYTNTNLTTIDTSEEKDGDSILKKIDDELTSLNEDLGKVKIDGTDTCPEFLIDKLEEGTNISFSVVGTGCDRKIRIDSTEGGVVPDVNAKVTANDTTSSYLDSKIETGSYLAKNILNPSGNEKIEIDVVPSTLISSDSGNQLTIGTDGGIKTTYSVPDGSETKIVQGTGVNISGQGTIVDPYIISTNPSILAARSCFTGEWNNISLVNTGNLNVVYSSGQPSYRIRFDGTIELKGNITYAVSFGNYSSGTRKHTVTIGNIALNCLALSELTGTADLKSINYIDAPQASVDQIVQQYGYIIRKSAQSIILEFQSSFTNATTKNIVVSFDGCLIHPNI